MASTPEQRVRLGERLRHWRHQRDLTLDAISDALKERGFTASASKVGGWSQGLYAPSTRDLAAALDEVVGAGGEIFSALGYGPTLAAPLSEIQAMSLEDVIRLLKQIGVTRDEVIEMLDRVESGDVGRSGDVVFLPLPREPAQQSVAAESGPTESQTGTVDKPPATGGFDPDAE